MNYNLFGQNAKMHQNFSPLVETRDMADMKAKRQRTIGDDLNDNMVNVCKLS